MRSFLFVVLVACGGAAQPRAIDNHVASGTPVPTAAPATHRVLEFRVVDSEAAFSKQLFAHVGPDNHGVPHDAKAAAAGIEGEIDAWGDDSGAHHTEYYLRGDRAALETYLSDAAKQDPALVVPSDRELVFETLDNGKVRTYLLEKTAELDERSVQTATRSQDPNTGRPMVLLDFTPAGTDALAKLTQRIVGKKLAILANGKLESAPIINDPITGGRASITMGGTDVAEQEREAGELARVLTKAVAH
jgi:preprotein translocase subunit SecD